MQDRLQKFKKLFLAQIRLLENAVFEQRRGNIFAVNGNRNVQPGVCAMK